MRPARCRASSPTSEGAYGLLEAIWTGGVLAGAWLLARAAGRARDDGALVYGLLLMLGFLCATLPVAATAATVVWLVPLWVLGGIANGGVNVYGNILIARRVPQEFRGRSYATLGATVNGAGMGGYAAGGLPVEALSIRPLVAGLGLAGLAVVGVLVLPVVRTVRRERGRPAAVPAADVGPVTVRPVRESVE